MKLSFLGANRQVTGSRYLLEAGGLRLMIDCGLFQERDFQDRNWESSPVPPGQIDALLLTHAHLDHVGLVPKLVREGFRRQIVATRASAELAGIILRDAAHIQVEDADFKRRRHRREGRKGRHPEKPLYDVGDAEDALELLRGVRYGEPVALNERVTARFHDAGHILGSAILELRVQGDGGERRLLFSGDLGQFDKVLVRDPSLLQGADYVVMESTYGDRSHQEAGDPEDQLCRILNDTVERGGNLVIPTFAVERAQELMFHLSRLVYEDRVPHLLAFLDSPMAVRVTDVFKAYLECLDEEAQQVLADREDPFDFPGLHLVRSVAESKAVNRIRGTCVIMAGSGMCTGGRIKHHLIRNLPRSESTVLFVGYQSKGTLGRQILEGAGQVRIHGRQHEVRARIEQIHGFSAHADREDLLRWVGHLNPAPQRVFLTHGEQDAAEALAQRLREAGLAAEVPKYRQQVELA